MTMTVGNGNNRKEIKMSLHNLIHGCNPFTRLFLSILSRVTPLPSIPRFRDVYVLAGTPPEIVLYTRTGGGNRERYAADIATLCAHPLFLRTFDDKFDPTYAHYVYAVPAPFAERVTRLQVLLSRHPSFQTPQEKLDRVLALMRNQVVLDPDPLTPEMEEEVRNIITTLTADCAGDGGIVDGFTPTIELKI